MNKKTTDILSYCTIIGWLIGFFAGTKNESKYHLNQGLVVSILGCACGIVATILSVIVSAVTPWYMSAIAAVINALIWLLFNVFPTVLMVLGIVAAAKGQEKELPLVGKIKILK